jgi:hypothetical protein
MKRAKLRIEKSGQHGTCEVAGWRYEGDSAWHVKVWPDNRDVSRNAYKVMFGLFDTDTASQAEREAVLHLITKWESELQELPEKAGATPDASQVA